MDLRELKQIAKQLGGIVVLNGTEPEIVILAYDQYRKLVMPELATSEAEFNQSDNPEIDRLNREILALKEEIRLKEEAELSTDENDDSDRESALL